MAIARLLLVVVGCALSACASRNPARVALPQSEQTGLSQSQADLARPQDESTQQDERDHKSYALPVVEILAMDTAFNLVGRVLNEPATFEVTAKTIRRNLRDPGSSTTIPFRSISSGIPTKVRCTTTSRGRTGSATGRRWPIPLRAARSGKLPARQRRPLATITRQRLCRLVPRRAALSYLPSPA